MKFVVLFISSVFALTSAAQVNLQEKYPFSVVLLDDGENYYGLHWNFTRATETIYFAVNVSTTGWVGFGLSPNGQMPNSDVVIGWVSGEQTYFHDRFAEGRFLPPIDESQDWELDNSEEENGFTLLEFSRSFVTCDSRDFPITSSTDRVVWSFNPNDPTSPNGEDAMFHTMQGSRTLNLLGGEPGVNTAPLESESFLDITVSNVTIPAASTTYWCESFRGPPELINTTQFINRVSPTITPHASSFVHHILVYLCREPLSDEEVGVSGPCDEVPENVRRCTSIFGTLLGAWAVGGEDQIYPEGVAQPVGGIGQEHFFAMEMHYDNPNNVEGVVDSSGMRFFFTTEEPEQRGGTIFFGHNVDTSMIIPPSSRNYTIAGICSAACTDAYIPAEGITVYANTLHTHLVGHGLTVQLYRFNTECNVFEEVEPIDQNLNYDFNFQQTVALPRRHLVLPGDIIVLKCFYDTMTRDTITVGGESTVEEMCLSFLNYYPKPVDNNILAGCISTPQVSSFNEFASYLQQNYQIDFDASDPESAGAILLSLDWEADPLLATTLESSILNSTVTGLCANERGDFLAQDTSLPDVKCPYQAPDRCTGFVPESCCDRLRDGAVPQVQVNMAITTLLVLLGMLMVKY